MRTLEQARTILLERENSAYVEREKWRAGLELEALGFEGGEIADLLETHSLTELRELMVPISPVAR